MTGVQTCALPICTNGDTHLGGEDFDNNMMRYFVDMLKKKKNIDVTKDQKALARLRKACEAAKRQLSSQPEARVEVDRGQGRSFEPRQ